MIAREGGHAPFSCVIKIASPGGGTVDKMVGLGYSIDTRGATSRSVPPRVD